MPKAATKKTAKKSAAKKPAKKSARKVVAKKATRKGAVKKASAKKSARKVVAKKATRKGAVKKASAKKSAAKRAPAKRKKAMPILAVGAIAYRSIARLLPRSSSRPRPPRVAGSAPANLAVERVGQGATPTSIATRLQWGDASGICRKRVLRREMWPRG